LWEGILTVYYAGIDGGGWNHEAVVGMSERDSAEEIFSHEEGRFL